ncbi:hypothetical protein [Microseira wollei]|nr:hypothetical protein [Microseira wollei]
MSGRLPLIKILRVRASGRPRVSPNYGSSSGHDITASDRIGVAANKLLPI